MPQRNVALNERILQLSRVMLQLHENLIKSTFSAFTGSACIIPKVSKKSDTSPYRKTLYEKCETHKCNSTFQPTHVLFDVQAAFML